MKNKVYHPDWLPKDHVAKFELPENWTAPQQHENHKDILKKSRRLIKIFAECQKAIAK